MQPSPSATPLLPLCAQNNHIPAIFRSGLTTNSYKYFWFLGLLDAAQDMQELDIPLIDIAVRMVQRAWYPVLFFRLHFGKMDKLENTILLAQKEQGIPADAKPDQIIRALQTLPPASEAAKALQALMRYVAYRILTPWFEDELRGMDDQKKHAAIFALSQQRQRSATQAPLYSFRDKETIRFTWDWQGYIRDHNAILIDFTFWRLAEFLQARNPNVPNIAAKLIPSIDTREQGKLRPSFSHFLQQHPGTRCIYSGLPLDRFDIDHFIPWSFVTHDLPWNLAPVHPKANNQKRDQLPNPALLTPFSQLQHDFLHHNHSAKPKHHQEILNTYEFLFQTTADTITAWPIHIFQTAFHERLSPLLMQARHQGFPGPWLFSE